MYLLHVVARYSCTVEIPTEIFKRSKVFVVVGGLVEGATYRAIDDADPAVRCVR